MGKDRTPTEPPGPDEPNEFPALEFDPKLITYLEEPQGVGKDTRTLATRIRERISRGPLGKHRTPTERPGPDEANEFPALEFDPRLITYLEEPQGVGKETRSLATRIRDFITRARPARSPR